MGRGPGLGQGWWGSAAFQGLRVDEETASQEGGKEAFRPHASCRNPQPLGVNFRSGKGKSFPSSSGPVTQARGRGRESGRGPVGSLGSLRVMSQLKG